MSDAQEATFVLPTTIAVHRYQQMKVEAILNTPYQVTAEKTPMEYCLGGEAGAEETVALLKLPEEQAEIALDLLEDALDGGDEDEIYGPRGGVLCILLPTTSTDQDLAYQAMDAEEDDGPSLMDFVHQPNELFSGLTPAQVWVGAGKHEMALADAFLPQLWARMKDKKFATPGQANTEWLSQLRLWSYNPAPGYRGRVIDIIVQERNENLARRRPLIEALGVESVLVTPPE